VLNIYKIGSTRDLYRLTSDELLRAMLATCFYRLLQGTEAQKLFPSRKIQCSDLHDR